MINSNSRYAQSTLVPMNYEGNDITVIVPGAQSAFSFNFIWYQLTALDRLDTLAYQFYLDPTLWWKIADANPEIMQWDAIELGTVIRVPVLQ